MIISGKRVKSLMSKHHLYRKFKRIKWRTTVKNANKDWERYGGRGIKICDEWLDNPENFIVYVEGLGWSSGVSIDRIDNDGNYEPGNIRLGTPILQANNRSTNRIETAFGDTDTFSNLVRKYGKVSYRRVQERFVKQGWNLEDALTREINPNLRLNSKKSLK